MTCDLSKNPYFGNVCDDTGCFILTSNSWGISCGEICALDNFVCHYAFQAVQSSCIVDEKWNCDQVKDVNGQYVDNFLCSCGHFSNLIYFL